MEYRLIRSDRRTVAIQILPDGAVLVRAPRRMAKWRIDAFVEEKENWILVHMPEKGTLPPKLTEGERKALARLAKEDLSRRVERFAGILGVSWGRITIRSQRTRWGSCSGKGNLNFNCLLMLAPEEIRDYVVVHELCHRLEMNHSSRFWGHVERILPDYRARRQWLKEKGKTILARLPE